MAKRALITGVTGQDGSYLAEFLLDQGYEVCGMVRRSSTVNFERIAHIQDRLTLVAGDLLDEVSMINILREHRPAEVQRAAGGAGAAEPLQYKTDAKTHPEHDRTLPVELVQFLHKVIELGID